MQLINLFLFALPSLFALSANIHHSNSKDIAIYDKKAQFNSSLLKNGLRTAATYQLVISNPSNSQPLLANNSYPILITSNPTQSPYPSVNVATDLVCDGDLKTSIPSILGQTSTFFIDPTWTGLCQLIATSLDIDYSDSAPLSVTINAPIYYEGAIDNVLYTSEVINNYLRASNNAYIKVTLRINCTSGSEVNIQYYTNTDNFYTLQSQLTGTCTFSTPVVPQFYEPIVPFNVIIEPTIKFVLPSQGQVYTAGTPITAKLVASDNTSPIVTVELTCESTVVATQTRSIASAFIFAPQPNIYGNCVLSIDPLAPYYTDDTVEISIKSALTFRLPSNGDIIGAGTNYNILVTGTAGNSVLTASVVGTCDVGGTFTQTVTLGVPTQVLMALGLSGRCVLTATVSEPNFTQATVTVFVLMPLTPFEASEAAVRFVITGGIVEITNNP